MRGQGDEGMRVRGGMRGYGVMRIRRHVCLYTYICVCNGNLYTYVYVYTYVYMCIYTYVHREYVHVYIYIYVFVPGIYHFLYVDVCVSQGGR